MTPSVTWISCGVLRAELEHLQSQGQLPGELVFLDSMLHMDPPRLQSALEQCLSQQPDATTKVVVFGDCCPRMAELLTRYDAVGVSCHNCASLLLSKERYRALMREAAFLLLPEWALRWREAFEEHLGLSESSARVLFNDHRGVLVYLDTGLAPVPVESLAECAAYTGLSYRVEGVPLDTLLSRLLAAAGTGAGDSTSASAPSTSLQEEREP